MHRHTPLLYTLLLCAPYSAHALKQEKPNFEEFKKQFIQYTQKPSFEELKRQFVHQDAWGLHTIIDLSNCDTDAIRSRDEIHRYIIELCQLIDMKRFGDPTIIHFGQDERVAGYSMFQLIETSNIAGHFANDTNNAYIDIFSCKLYDPYQAAAFTKNFFKAEKVDIHIVLR